MRYSKAFKYLQKESKKGKEGVVKNREDQQNMENKVVDPKSKHTTNN